MASSPPIPSRPSPKPRNSETGDLMRRSFRANPFPADLSRRNSIGREIKRLEFGEKENQCDKDQISNMVKVLKGTKNFMSPTISAASKINPSPRKKILSEKNEVSRSFDKSHHQVRSSVSFSDVVSIIGDDKDQEEICIDEKKQLDENEAHDITVTDFDKNHGNESNGDFDDLCFKSSSPLPPSVPFTFPEFGSHEVDPSVTPYDPKKNFLSPRPQFLHYRPNPRLEHRSEECKQLDDLFISESSSSEADLSTEESQQEEDVTSQEAVVEPEEEEAEVIQDEDHLKAVEIDEEEAEAIKDEDDENHLKAAECDEEDEEVIVSESTVEEETHQVSSRSCFKISKVLGWVLVLGVACLLLFSVVAYTQPNIIQDSPFYKFNIPPEITKSATESFEKLSGKLRMLTESSLVYMDKLISSLREEEGYGSFQFHNLTDVLEDTRLSDTVFQLPSGEINVAGLLMDIEKDIGAQHEPEEPENGGEIDHEDVYEEYSNEIEEEGEGGEVNSEIVYELDEQTVNKMATDTEMNGGEDYSESLSVEESCDQETVGVEGQMNYEENDQQNLEEGHDQSETRLDQNDEKIMEGADVESAAINGHQQVDMEEANLETVSEEESISAETADTDGNGLEEESRIGEEVVAAADWKEILLNNKEKVIVLFSTVLVLLAAAAAAFLLAKKKGKPAMKLPEDGEPTTISDIKAENSERVPVKNLINRLSSLNFKEEEEEEVEDERKKEVSSFPSEMSFSFHKNKSLHSCNNSDGLKEYQSWGGGGRRKSNDSGESMASSASEYSIGSVSYGSFTTYEKIQKKSGRKEGEIVTPVRRSSRIRNSQHSGQ